MRTQLGDRIYLVAKGRLVGLGTRTMQAVTPIEFDAPVTAMAATPSGDRLFVATDSSTALSVVDRYRERVTSSIELAGEPLELRMDPLGRWLLVRAKKDSVWVIGVADGRVVGKTATRWHNDLPFVAPDGRIALAEKNDVVFVDASLQERARVAGGASDFWYSFLWAGFRPRDASLDRSEPLPGADTTDSTLMMPPVAADSLLEPPLPTDTAQRPPAVRGFIVSFAALLSEERARELAGQIRVGGQAARIITTARNGTSVYRVVLGPYPTRDEAERIGRESGQPSWWVYEGVP